MEFNYNIHFVLNVSKEVMSIEITAFYDIYEMSVNIFFKTCIFLMLESLTVLLIIVSSLSRHIIKAHTDTSEAENYETLCGGP